MGAVMYADDLLLIAPNMAAMEIMLKECEDFAEESNIQFSTDPDPRRRLSPSAVTSYPGWSMPPT